MKNLKIICFILICYFFFLNSYGLLDPDEPRYAATSKNMVISGNYLIPEFNGHLRINKPPLTYWLISLSYKIFGINEFAARFPHAFLSILLLFIVVYISKNYISSDKAYLSAIILASTPFYFFFSRLCNTDMILNFFFACSMLLFFKYYEKNKLKYLILSLLCYLFANLTKGPVAYLIPVIIAIFLVSEKKFLFFKKFYLIIITILISLSSLLWLFYVGLKTGSIDSLKSLIFNETLGRMFKGYAHKEPFYFYLIYFPLLFFPWSVIIFFSKINLKFNKYLKFNLIWFLTVFLFFSLSKSKLISYILPLSMPFSIIVASLIEELKFKINFKYVFSGVLIFIGVLTGYLVAIQEFQLNLSILMLFLVCILLWYIKNLCSKCTFIGIISIFLLTTILTLSGKYISDLKSERFLKDINFPKDFKIIVFRKKLTGCAFYKGNYNTADSIEKLKELKDGSTFILTSTGMYDRYLKKAINYKIVFKTKGRVLLQ